MFFIIILWREIRRCYYYYTCNARYSSVQYIVGVKMICKWKLIGGQIVLSLLIFPSIRPENLPWSWHHCFTSRGEWGFLQNKKYMYIVFCTHTETYTNRTKLQMSHNVWNICSILCFSVYSCYRCWIWNQPIYPPLPRFVTNTQDVHSNELRKYCFKFFYKILPSSTAHSYSTH